MSHKIKKAAPEATSEESVTTKSAESQEQPTTTPDGSTTGDVPAVQSKNLRGKSTVTRRVTVSSKKLNEEAITCPTCTRYGERVEFDTLEELAKHMATHPDPVWLARTARDARKILNASQLNGKSPVTDVEKYEFAINYVKSQTRFNDSAAGVFVSLVRLSNDNLYVVNVWLHEVDDVAAKTLFDKATFNHAQFLSNGNLDPIEQASVSEAQHAAGATPKNLTSTDTVTCFVCKQAFPVNRKSLYATQNEDFVKHVRSHYEGASNA